MINSILGSRLVFKQLKTNLATNFTKSNTFNGFNNLIRTTHRRFTSHGDRSVGVSFKKSYPGVLPLHRAKNSATKALRVLDYVGTVSFAVGGCITAGHAGMDALGCTIVGTITAVGGGTVRDLLLGQLPVYWVAEVEYIALCVIAGLATFFWHIDDKNEVDSLGKDIIPLESQFMYWMDSIGLGAFCVIGTQNGIRMRMHPLICILSGMFTATFGGLLRDVLCERHVKILRPTDELYASATLIGSSAYIIVKKAGGSRYLRIASGLLACIGMRVLASDFHLTLPVAVWNSDSEDSSDDQSGHN
jgi:uncharacterized membrane protein YeiH